MSEGEFLNVPRGTMNQTKPEELARANALAARLADMAVEKASLEEVPPHFVSMVASLMNSLIQSSVAISLIKGGMSSENAKELVKAIMVATVRGINEKIDGYVEAQK